jgi:hypothetical protein
VFHKRSCCQTNTDPSTYNTHKRIWLKYKVSRFVTRRNRIVTRETEINYVVWDSISNMEINFIVCLLAHRAPLRAPNPPQPPSQYEILCLYTYKNTRVNHSATRILKLTSAPLIYAIWSTRRVDVVIDFVTIRTTTSQNKGWINTNVVKLLA